MTQPPYQVAPQCYRHPGRETYIGCQRCGRPICPECMISAAVGFQCPECVAEGMRTTRQNRTPYGGHRATNPSATSLALIGINAVVWLLLTVTGGGSSPWFSRLALLPTGRCVPIDDPGRYFPGVNELVCLANAGATEWIPGVADGAYWQVLTSAFAHVDLFHIGFNMLALWFLGPNLERVVGRARFLAIYLLSAVAGSVAVMWLSDPDVSTIGASGAVFGLMGGLVIVARKVGADMQPILLWLGINLVYTFVAGGSISWQGHVGGLLGGLATAAIIVFAPREQRARFQQIGLTAVAVALVVLLAVRIAMLA